MIVNRKSSRRYYRYGGSSLSNRTKYRYGGNGIFSTIGRKLIGDNIKKLINTVSKSNILHKAANAVQDGATNALKAETQKGLEQLASHVSDKIKKKSTSSKKQIKNLVNTLTHRLSALPTTASSIESIVRGQGIVYD